MGLMAIAATTAAAIGAYFTYKCCTKKDDTFVQSRNSNSTSASSYHVRSDYTTEVSKSRLNERTALSSRPNPNSNTVNNNALSRSAIFNRIESTSQKKSCESSRIATCTSHTVATPITRQAMSEKKELKSSSTRTAITPVNKNFFDEESFCQNFNQHLASSHYPSVSLKKWNSDKQRLPDYNDEMREAERITKEPHGQYLLNEYCEADLQEKFSSFDFLKLMKVSLMLIHHEEQEELKKCTLKNRTFSIISRKKRELRIKIELMKEDYKIISDDKVGKAEVSLTNLMDKGSTNGRVEKVKRKSLEISILLPKPQYGQVQPNTIDEKCRYQIDFHPNKFSLRTAFRAIESAIAVNMRNFLISFSNYNSHDYFVHFPEHYFHWVNSSIRENQEQRDAVMNIVNQTSFPSPYIVFGPPGTGKTTTICEAIIQVTKLRPSSHILVTADSNSTCDDIAVRLLKFIIDKDVIFRVYSSSKFEEIHHKLKHVSNFSSSDNSDTLSLESFKKARIIICTLVTCGQIVAIQGQLQPGHFDYIFIDEAGCQSEQNTLIPIAGLAYFKNGGVTAQIVLSGDHKQLGAVVKSELSKKMGMETSMMERMMTTVPKYKNFEKNFVSYLVKNYRSHEAIIEFSNTQFYDEKLKFLCPEEKKNFAIGWKSLRNKNFPVLFHHSTSNREFDGKSSNNRGEATIAFEYVQSLMNDGINENTVDEEDIGVIAPYKAQVELLKNMINMVYSNVEIGTVDAFQGREKKIIIVTTVQSNSKSIGFLENDKRLNVALTRAQALLIIIGNSNTLRTSPMWNKFVEYCEENGSIIYPRIKKSGNRRSKN